MNNKSLIVSVVVVGLSLGLFGSYLNAQRHNHSEHSETDHSNHEMHQKMNHSDHLDDHTEKPGKKMVVSDAFRATLDKTTMAYFDLQKALSKDNFTQAKKTSKWLQSKLNKKSPTDLSKSVQKIWAEEKTNLDTSLRDVQSSKTISEARQAFERISLSVETLIIHFGAPKGQQVSKYHCPMVNNNKGATWLQNSDGTKNPYYGSQMFSCGNKVKEM